MQPTEILARSDLVGEALKRREAPPSRRRHRRRRDLTTHGIIDTVASFIKHRAGDVYVPVPLR